MGSKFGLLLSMFFVAIFFALSGDMLGLQLAYNSLESKAATISYLIAKRGNISDDFVASINSKYDVNLIYKGNKYPLFGDDVYFQIQTEFKPMIISNEPITLTVNRSAVIGYYG